MDLEWIKLAIQFGSALAGGLVAAVGAFYALRGKIDLLAQRVTTLENMENTSVEMRLANIEDKLRLEKFEEFWRWQTTVNNRLDRLEK